MPDSISYFYFGNAEGFLMFSWVQDVDGGFAFQSVFQTVIWCDILSKM